MRPLAFFGQAWRSHLAPLGAALRRYGALVLAGGLPLIVGLGAVALLPPRERSSVFIYQENMALVFFWCGFLGGALVSWLIGGVWVMCRQTERVRRDERQAAAAAKQRLLRNLDHELRTPLTTMGLSVENLR